MGQRFGIPTPPFSPPPGKGPELPMRHYLGTGWPSQRPTAAAARFSSDGAVAGVSGRAVDESGGCSGQLQPPYGAVGLFYAISW